MEHGTEIRGWGMGDGGGWQEAEGKAAAAEERERSCNERMTQTLSRCAVMEAHLSLLRAEQSQTARSLEKERSRAGESRQEYLAAQEGAVVHEGRARQLEGELKEARAKAWRELQEERACRDALEQEVEAERAAMAEHEKRSRAEKAASALRPTASMSSSLGSAEEHLLVAGGVHGQEGGALLSLGPTSPFGSSRSLLGSAGGMEQIEKRLRHREGELSSYGARVVRGLGGVGGGWAAAERVSEWGCRQRWRPRVTRWRRSWWGPRRHWRRSAARRRWCRGCGRSWRRCEGGTRARWN